MKKSTYYFLFIITVFFLYSCNNDEPKPSGCCDNPAINEAVGIGHVYIPNIFTPDNDGINDFLTVFGDHNIKVVRSFIILDRNSQILYYSYDFPPNNPLYGWDGRIKNSNASKGLYRVTAEVEAIDGTINILSGLVCNFRCDDDAKENDPLNTMDCRFPTQNEDGHFNLNFPSGEPGDCFE